jgi:hypothetical protein
LLQPNGPYTQAPNGWTEEEELASAAQAGRTTIIQERGYKMLRQTSRNLQIADGRSGVCSRGHCTEQELVRNVPDAVYLLYSSLLFIVESMN